MPDIRLISLDRITYVQININIPDILLIQIDMITYLFYFNEDSAFMIANT